MLAAIREIDPDIMAIQVKTMQKHLAAMLLPARLGAMAFTLFAGLALALGLSMRFLHHRVDSFVDSVFFRKRHDNERALRRFARLRRKSTATITTKMRTQW